MKVKVDPSKCIGCGYCVGECDEVFEFNEDNISHVTKSVVPENLEDTVSEIVDSCPTSAIELEK